VASPLGLRLSIGAPGEKAYDYDFLSSIEVLIIDQVEVFLMQNWEHLVFILDSLNQLPKSSHNTDFSRVMNWYLNGCAKNFRQTILFTSFMTPEINAIWNRKCENSNGKFKTLSRYEDGTVTQTLSNIRQVFSRLNTDSMEELSDTRFKYFTEQIFTKLLNSEQQYTLVFIPSYFDFVRVRNYLKKSGIEFCQCSEYTSQSKVSQGRSYFEQGRVPVMLFTERFHFYHRYQIKGIRNIVFYGLPLNPHFYSEILNFMDGSDGECSALFSKFDKFALERIVGSKRCNRMITGEKSTYLLC